MNTRNYSRLVPGEEIDAVRQWRFDDVDLRGHRLLEQARSEQQSADLARDQVVRQEAFAQGVTQGELQAQARVQQQMAEFTAQQGQAAGAQLAQLLAAAQLRLAEAEQTIAQGVLELACELARNLLRRELALDPQAIKPVLLEALGLLLVDAAPTVVRLNPLDHAALEAGAAAEFAQLSLLADPAIERGGCLVESAGSVVDARLQQRWRRALANLGLELPWSDDDEPA